MPADAASPSPKPSTDSSGTAAGDSSGVFRLPDSAASVAAIRVVKAVCPSPTCGKKYRLEEKYAGRSLKCRACGEKFEVGRDVRMIEKPPAKEPPAWLKKLRAAGRFLAGTGGKKGGPRKLKTLLSDKGVRRVRWAAAAALVFGFAGCVAVWMRTDSAKILLSHQQGKEIAFRRIVELEEELAAALAAVEDKDDVPWATRQADGIYGRQADLWATLSGWKNDGFLVQGEVNQFMTRYGKQLDAATQKVSAARMRIAKLDGASGKKFGDLLREHKDGLYAARKATLDLPKSPFAKKDDAKKPGGRLSGFDL